MIKLKDLLEGKNYNSPGYENRQFGDPLPTLEDITRKYQEGKESVDENILKQIQQAEKIAKSMAGNMTGAVKGIEKIRRGLSHHKRVKVALKKYNESVNEANNIDKIKDILKNKSMKKVSGVMVDMQTANAIVTVHKALGQSNRKKFEKLPIKKMASVAWKLVK